MLSRLLYGLPFRLVDCLQDFLPFFGSDIFRFQEVDPELAVADANNEIFFIETEAAQNVDAKRDEFDISCDRRLADDIAIQLVMFAQTAALLFFVAKKLADGKPLERFPELALVRGDDPGERWRELGAQRDLAFAFVGEVEELSDDFVATFLFVELGRLEHGAVPFHKAIAARDFAPFRKNIISRRAIAWQKVAKTGQWLHR